MLMEGPPAAQVLSKVFNGLSSNRIRDLEQLITDYENGVGETKQGDCASLTLQRDFNVEMGQYIPADKQIKVAQFEQVCLKEGTTLFLAVDWLGGDAITLVNKSAQDFQVSWLMRNIYCKCSRSYILLFSFGWVCRLCYFPRRHRHRHRHPFRLLPRLRKHITSPHL